MPRTPARFPSRAEVPDVAAVASGTHGGTFERASLEQNSRISVVVNSTATGRLLIRVLLALLTRGRMALDVDLVNADVAVFQCDRS
jgi:hypothetical protein